LVALTWLIPPLAVVVDVAALATVELPLGLPTNWTTPNMSITPLRNAAAIAVMIWVLIFMLPPLSPGCRDSCPSSFAA
jgi:hypothetical protein